MKFHLELLQARKRKAVVARDGFWTVSASEVKRAKRLAQYDAKEFSTFNDEEEERREKEREKQQVTFQQFTISVCFRVI